MHPDRLTQKTRDARDDAQTEALRYGHTEVGREHLLLALLDQSDGLVAQLLRRIQTDPHMLRSAVARDLASRPRVNGPGAAPGQVRVSRRLNEVLDGAEREAERLKDESVSVEHVLLALLATGPGSAAGRMLHDHGVTRKRLLKALSEVRGTPGA